VLLTVVLIAVGVLWFLATCQGAWSLVSGLRFYRYVQRHLADGNGSPCFAPPAAVILPCCGLDERLSDTVKAVLRQDYPDYEVIFAFESSEDPAFTAVGRWASAQSVVRWRRVVAGPAESCSQKIQNLLAGLASVSADRETLAFLDSDAIPPRGWLTGLVRPLGDPTIGATTGFRWYTTNGTLAGGVRSAWNAASVTFLHDEKLAFCWGGSTAVRRGTFDRLDIAARWRRALSDDYQVTRAVRDAGLRIHFVPRCLLPSPEETTLRGFFTFARRQLVITRVCAPKVWRTGLGLACNFIVGATAVAATAVWAYFDGRHSLMIGALAAWGVILALAGLKSILRQMAVRKVLRPPDVSRADFLFDVIGVGFIGVLHLVLLLSSARSRRLAWRNRLYEMVSPDETLVLGRTEPAGPARAPQPMVGLT